MKKIVFLLLLSVLASCWQNKKVDENKTNTSSSTLDESTVSTVHDPSLWTYCTCASCLWININQKDEFIL